MPTPATCSPPFSNCSTFLRDGLTYLHDHPKAECEICYKAYDDDVRAVQVRNISGCTHIFCFGCLNKWLTIFGHRTCPKCRRNFYGAPTPHLAIHGSIFLPQVTLGVEESAELQRQMTSTVADTQQVHMFVNQVLERELQRMAPGTIIHGPTVTEGGHHESVASMPSQQLQEAISLGTPGTNLGNDWDIEDLRRIFEAPERLRLQGQRMLEEFEELCRQATASQQHQTH